MPSPQPARPLPTSFSDAVDQLLDRTESVIEVKHTTQVDAGALKQLLTMMSRKIQVLEMENERTREMCAAARQQADVALREQELLKDELRQLQGTKTQADTLAHAVHRQGDVVERLSREHSDMQRDMARFADDLSSTKRSAADAAALAASSPNAASRAAAVTGPVHRDVAPTMSPRTPVMTVRHPHEQQQPPPPQPQLYQHQQQPPPQQRQQPQGPIPTLVTVDRSAARRSTSPSLYSNARPAARPCDPHASSTADSSALRDRHDRDPFEQVGDRRVVDGGVVQVPLMSTSDDRQWDRQREDDEALMSALEAAANDRRGHTQHSAYRTNSGAHNGEGVAAPRRAMAGLELTDTPSGYPKVAGVKPSGPGQVAGLIVGDVVLRIDGHNITRKAEFAAYLEACSPGQGVKLAYRRGQGVLETTMFLGGARA